MRFPRSLAEDIRARAFCSGDEWAVPLSDAPAALAACTADGLEILGWELWIIDHEWSSETNELVSARGRWTGLVPVAEGRLSVVHGEGDAQEILRQIDNIDSFVAPELRDDLRINFTIDD